MGKPNTGAMPQSPADYLPAPQNSVGNLSRFTSAHSQSDEDGVLKRHSTERSNQHPDAGVSPQPSAAKPTRSVAHTHSNVTFQERTIDDMVDDIERRQQKEKQHKVALPLRGLKLGPITVFYLPLLLTLVLLTVSISFIIWASDFTFYAFPLWSIFMFFALMYPLLLLADIIVFVFVLLLERVFLRVQFVLYFIMGSRRTLMWFLWSVFLLLTFIILFSGNSYNSTGDTLYAIFLRVLICVMLFMVAMILKHVLEKLIGYTCHEEAYFKRMRKALRHEFHIMALSEPPKVIGLSQRVMARMSMHSLHIHHGEDSKDGKVGGPGTPLAPGDGDLNQHADDMLVPLPSTTSAFSAEGKAAALRAAALAAAAAPPGAVTSPFLEGFLEGSVSSTAGGTASSLGVGPPGSSLGGPAASIERWSALQGGGTSAQGGSATAQGGSATRQGDPGQCAPPPGSPQPVTLGAPPRPPLAPPSSPPTWPPDVEGSAGSAAPTSRGPSVGRWARGLSMTSKAQSGTLPSPASEERAPSMPSMASKWRASMRRSRPACDLEEGQRPSSPGDDTRSYASARTSLPGGASLGPTDDLPPATSSAARRRREVKKTVQQLTTVRELHSALEASESPSNASVNGLHARSASQASMDALPGTNVQVLEAISLMEKHIRKSRLRSPLTEQLRDVLEPEGGGVGGNQRADAVEREGRQLAFYLFYHIKGPDVARDYLTLGDLHVFLSPKDATKAFAMLGAKGDEDQLTLPIMCEAVVALVKERVALAAALKGSKTVVAQVGHVVGVIIHIIFIFLYLLVFGYSATQVWVAISGAILGFSFIFASYLSAIFTCIMYLLTVHPFEVGDIIIINKTYYEVQKILLQHTQLKDSNGAVLWYPNIKMDVDIDIEQVLAEAHRCLSAFLADNRSEFSGTYNIVMSAIVDPLKAELTLVYELSHNGVNLRRTANARSAIYQCLAKVLLLCEVRYSQAPLPLEGPGLVGGAQQSPEREGGGLDHVLVRRPVRPRTVDDDA